MKQIICSFYCNSWWQNLHCVKEPQTGMWHGWHCAINTKGRCHAQGFLAKHPSKIFMEEEETLFYGYAESTLMLLSVVLSSLRVGEQLSFLFLSKYRIWVLSAFEFSSWLAVINVVLSVTTGWRVYLISPINTCWTADPRGS